MSLSKRWHPLLERAVGDTVTPSQVAKLSARATTHRSVLWEVRDLFRVSEKWWLPRLRVNLARLPSDRRTRLTAGPPRLAKLATKPDTLGLSRISHVLRTTRPARLVAESPQGVLVRRVQGSGALNLAERAQAPFYAPRVVPLASASVRGTKHTNTALLNATPAVGSTTRAGTPVRFRLGENHFVTRTPDRTPGRAAGCDPPSTSISSSSWESGKAGRSHAAWQA